MCCKQIIPLAHFEYGRRSVNVLIFVDFDNAEKRVKIKIQSESSTENNGNLQDLNL